MVDENSYWWKWGIWRVTANYWVQLRSRRWIILCKSKASGQRDPPHTHGINVIQKTSQGYFGHWQKISFNFTYQPWKIKVGEERVSKLNVGSFVCHVDSNPHQGFQFLQERLLKSGILKCVFPSFSS